MEVSQAYQRPYWWHMRTAIFLACSESQASGATAGVLTGLSAAVCSGGPGAPPFLRKLHTRWCGSLMQEHHACVCSLPSLLACQVTLMVSLGKQQLPLPLHLAGQAVCLRNLQRLQA